jgi:hypothetical protein
VTANNHHAPANAGYARAALRELLMAIALLVAWSVHAQSMPSGISVLETRRLGAADLQWNLAAPATHDLRLTLVVLNETGWNAEGVIEAARRIAPLIAQCGVRMIVIDVLLLNVPARFRNFETQVAREFARLMPVPRPAVYFVADTFNRPAFDAEAIGRANSRNRPELADTIWVAAGTRDLPVALAHELVHLLMDSGDHSNEAGNLMRDETAAQNTQLTAMQCARLRETAQRNGLLVPAKN